MRPRPLLIYGTGGSELRPIRSGNQFQDSKRRFLAAGMMSVRTKMSCSRPRSLAEGVRIVFGPMYSFRLRVSAMRMSFSLRNSATSMCGGSGWAGAATAGGSATATGAGFGEGADEANPHLRRRREGCGARKCRSAGNSRCSEYGSKRGLRAAATRNAARRENIFDDARDCVAIGNRR